MRKIGRSEFELLKNKNIEEGKLPRGYLSPSSISKLQNCGEQYRRYYVEGEAGGPPSPKMQLGTDVHQMVEDFCTLFFENCKGQGVDPLGVTASNRLELFPSLREVLEYNSCEDEQAQNIYALWHKEMSESLYVPLSSENTYYCAVGDTPIMAKVDLVLLDLATNTTSVVDLKVGVKKRNSAESTQLSIYSVATGYSNVGYWQMVPPKIRVGAKSVMSTTEVDNRFLDFVEMTIQAAAQAISAGIFLPAQPGDWMCSEKYCGHFEKCRGGEK